MLRVIERPVRDPDPGEVRLAVRAAAVNPTDIVLRERGAEDLEPPWVPGMDAAGVVESVGSGVDRLAVGDAVMAAVAPRRPEGLLASYAIPLAKLRGLRVLADAKPEDEALVRSFGADVVVPRGAGFPESVDGFFDTAVLGRSAFPAIRDGGALAVVRGWNDGDSERGIRIEPVLVRTVLERTDWLEHLRELASQGTLQLRVAATYPPEGAADAQRLMEAGGLRGRAVIVF